jgi:hypothetical protein
MSKLYTAGIAALFAAVSIAATTVPAAAGGGHGHHGHHGHGHGHGNWGGNWGGVGIGFGTVVIADDPDPIYCMGRHGKLYICGWQ